jgi:guanylate kinase
LWRRLVEHPQVGFSVSATTRSPRPGEVDGKDYFFVSEERFEELIQQGDLLEHANVHGCSYGTLKSEVEKALQLGLDIVLEIDVQGAEQLRESGLPLVTVFVMPPSFETLVKRLRSRGSESEEQIARRLSIAQEEMSQADLYDHVVVNDNLETMIQEVHKLLGLQQEPAQ